MAEDDSFALFGRLQSLWNSLDGGDESTAKYQSDLTRGIDLAESAARAIDREALFSTNEEIDDIPTASVPLLLVPYYAATLRLRIRTPPNEPLARLEILRTAADELKAFAATAERLRILKPEECASADAATATDSGAARRAVDPATARAEKIAAFKRKKEAKAILDDINRRMADATKGKSKGKDESAMDEETERARAMALVRFSAIDSVEQLKMTEREAEMVDQVARMKRDGSYEKEKQRHEDERRRREANGTAPKVFTIMPGQFDGQAPQIQPMPSSVQGRGKLVDKRAEFRAGVFKPSHTMATISPQEAAEMEMLESQVSEAASKQHGSDEDDSDKEDDEKVRKARDWDTFRDDNPRGWGNTKGQG